MVSLTFSMSLSIPQILFICSTLRAVFCFTFMSASELPLSVSVPTRGRHVRGKISEQGKDEGRKMD